MSLLQRKPKPTLSHVESYEDFTQVIQGEGLEFVSFRYALEYDLQKVPKGGAEVIKSNSAPISRASSMKEAAGRHFHAKVRQSLGLEATDEKILRAAKLAGRGRDSLSSFVNEDEEEEEVFLEEDSLEDRKSVV